MFLIKTGDFLFPRSHRNAAYNIILCVSYIISETYMTYVTCHILHIDYNITYNKPALYLV